MPAISTKDYLLDQAKRRLTPSFNNFPGMGLVERKLLDTDFPQRPMATPPPGSDLKPVIGDAGLPIIGHMIEMFRGGPDYLLHIYRKYGPLYYADSPALPAVAALGPDAAQAVYSNRNKDFSQQGWVPVIGPFFHRGLMLLDFEEHMFHRRIMQEAFVRTRLVGYQEQVDKVVSQVIANDWVPNDPRFLMYPAMKELTLDIASMVFMGHEPGTDKELVTKVNKAFTTTTRAGNAIIRTGVPPFTWWRGLQARKLLENYFEERVKERRGKEGSDLLTVLCHTEDEDGNKFSDSDIVNHMIFLMMAAHDTSTSTATTMIYHLARNPEWQERCRDESDRLGDGPVDIEALEKLESLDLVLNESIRLVTPVQWAMRQTVRDTELLGYYLPKGTNVIAYPGMNHRLEEFYPEPMKFDPERFTEPRNEHKKHRYAFSPFGGGAHKCIGMTFGQFEVKTILHRLLRKYHLELPRPDYTTEWDYGGMPVPKDGMHIVLRPLR
ncbi:cytochrome P450 [Mycobacterium sp. 1274761.0]|uniref:cytochrome P450 n=1 Tax=Mycobacterium sp. 1274761.0 TaxID=1834077 RepID=UPI0007FD0211|nr:cytochrome P450 [Mycobacterium sp. 1274761.0]OBK74043.1 cytochrome P450 [Mycobacterium sp. 1274761.0]